MKKQYLLLSILMGISFALFLPSCTKQSCDEVVTYTLMEPVYLSYEDLRTSVAIEAPKVLESPGKIMLRGNFLYVNEYKTGFHVIDNSDPANPQKVAFVNIPGNVDLASKGNRLYADSYSDLVTFDISNPYSIQEVNRTNDVFASDWQMGLITDPELGVVVDWTPNTVTEERNCEVFYPYTDGDVFFMSTSNDQSAGAPTESVSLNENGFGTRETPGIGLVGSTARFSIVSDFLYAVSSWDLRLFSISNPDIPSLTNTINVGWNIETLFPYKNALFIGSQQGMFIYNIEDPANPVYNSEFTHATSCDPVVVDNEYAYVTLRNGNGETECGGWENQLDVINIENPFNPWHVATFDMFNPHGLSIDDARDQLYVCDGTQGLKVYDSEDVTRIGDNLLQNFQGLQANDVITFNDLVMLIGADGFYQYKLDSNDQLTEISSILVGQ